MSDCRASSILKTVSVSQDSEHPHIVVLRRFPINLRDPIISAKIPANRSNPNLSLPSDFFPLQEKIFATCHCISDGLTNHANIFSTGEKSSMNFNLTCETKSFLSHDSV